MPTFSVSAGSRRFVLACCVGLAFVSAGRAASPCTLPPPPPPPVNCTAGMKCVDKVLFDMGRRLDALAAPCDHNAVFALVYLRTTEEFKRAAQTPGFFADTDYLLRQDVLFARYYTDAYDAWARGDRGRVPQAWRIAFDAARDRAVSGTGNILLGMNAHINRDLPYVLAALGLAFPDGRTRKPDHDKVNDFLWNIVRPALDESAARFDPSIDDANLPGTTLDEQVFFQLVVSWREGAWQNAVRLVQAATPAERALVEASIEAAAAATAQVLRLQNAYLPPLTTSAARDAWCAAHRDGIVAEPTGHVQPGPGTTPSPLLSAAFPNPFNPQTAFTLAVDAEQRVRVEAFDLLGRRVALLHDGLLAAGMPHRFTFDAAHLPSGVYLLRAQGEHFVRQQQVQLLK